MTAEEFIVLLVAAAALGGLVGVLLARRGGGKSSTIAAHLDGFPAVAAVDVTDDRLLPRRFDSMAADVRDILLAINDRVVPEIGKLGERMLDLEHQQAKIFDLLGEFDRRIDRLGTTAVTIDHRVSELERRVDELVSGRK